MLDISGACSHSLGSRQNKSNSTPGLNVPKHIFSKIDYKCCSIAFKRKPDFDIKPHFVRATEQASVTGGMTLIKCAKSQKGAAGVQVGCKAASRADYNVGLSHTGREVAGRPSLCYTNGNGNFIYIAYFIIFELNDLYTED